jgi:hypothetical protein
VLLAFSCPCSSPGADTVGPILAWAVLIAIAVATVIAGFRVRRNRRRERDSHTAN